MKKIYERNYPVGESSDIGDVLLLTNGRLVRVASTVKGKTEFYNGYFMLQYVDQYGEAMQEDDGTIDIERNLGQTDEVLASFYTSRSIHLRLNDAKLFS